MAVFGLLQYYREQWTKLPPVQNDGDVSSQTFLLTGSNIGLGYEASMQLVRMAPKLLVATCRDEAKCERTRQSILERMETEGVACSPRAVAAWPLELDSFDNVRSFVDRFAAGGRVDSEAEGDEPPAKVALNALVANAALSTPDYVQTRDGWETVLQVNYLSAALLSILLLPYLVNASTPESPSRLVMVSSFGHYLAPPALKHAETWTDLLETVNGPNFGSGITRYNVTKLFQIMFIRELVARLPDAATTPVVACSVNPGFCLSGILRAFEHRWYMHWIFPVVRQALWVRSTKEGSKTLVHPVVAPGVRAMHGRYLSNCEVTEESDFLFTPQGKAISAKLWDETISVLSHADSRVSEIVAKYLRTGA